MSEGKTSGMKGRVAALLIFLACAAAVLSHAQNATKDDKTSGSGGSLPASVVPPAYLIGADDVLLISVWKEPDLTTTLPVRPDGNISLPLLNDVPAAGLTPMQLAASITEKLKKFVGDPRVTVVVTQVNSKRIYVTGEVQHTGAIQLIPDMTVLQALASAGFTQFANTKGIYVLRTSNGQSQKIPINYKRLLRGQDMKQNIVLQPGDTIVVP